MLQGQGSPAPTFALLLEGGREPGAPQRLVRLSFAFPTQVQTLYIRETVITCLFTSTPEDDDTLRGLALPSQRPALKSAVKSTGCLIKAKESSLGTDKPRLAPRAALSWLRAPGPAPGLPASTLRTHRLTSLCRPLSPVTSFHTQPTPGPELPKPCGALELAISGTAQAESQCRHWALPPLSPVLPAPPTSGPSPTLLQPSGDCPPTLQLFVMPPAPSGPPCSDTPCCIHEMT